MSKTCEVKVAEVCLEGTQPSIVDASRFISGTPTQQRGFAIELAESVRRCGFVKVINHGLPDELIDELFAWVSFNSLPAIIYPRGARLQDCRSFRCSCAVQNERFFALEPQQKQAIAHPPGPSPQRGWSCVGAEKTSRLFSRGKASVDLTDARVSLTRFDLQETSLAPSVSLMEDAGAF